jgi:hypothetical protein
VKGLYSTSKGLYSAGRPKCERTLFHKQIKDFIPQPDQSGKGLYSTSKSKDFTSACYAFSFIDLFLCQQVTPICILQTISDGGHQVYLFEYGKPNTQQNHILLDMHGAIAH